MIDFLGGTLLMLAILAAVGITQGRWLAQGPWVVAWVSTSAALAALISADFLVRNEISEFLHGMALGYIVGVTIHVSHHMTEGLRSEVRLRTSPWARGRPPE